MNLLIKEILKNYEIKNYSGGDKKKKNYFLWPEKIYIHNPIYEKNVIIQKETCTKAIYHMRKWYYTKVNPFNFSFTHMLQYNKTRDLESWF